MRRRGFTQADAGRYLEMGQDHLSHILAGRRSPGLETAIKFARLTGIPVEAWSSNAIDEASISEPVETRKR